MLVNVGGLALLVRASATTARNYANAGVLNQWEF